MACWREVVGWVVGRRQEEQGRVVVAGHPDARYPNNRVTTAKYSLLTFLPKNLFEQFHRLANIYFLFIIVLNWIPAINSFDKEISVLPLVLVVATTAAKDMYEDWRRHLGDRRVNRRACRVHCRRQGAFVGRVWEEVRVGDLVELVGGEQVPADMLLLRTSTPGGRCAGCGAVQSSPGALWRHKTLTARRT